MMTRRALAASAAFFVALTVPAPARATTSVPCPVVTAHAAGKLHAPENTVVGIEASGASGASMVEMDVRWSANANTQANPGYPVLMHDATLDRTTNGTGNVADTGLTALTALLAQDYAPWRTDPTYANVHVPWAYEFIQASRAAGVDMLLDVKVTPGEWGARKLMQYVDQASMASHLIYMGSPASVTAMRGWFPDLRYAVIEYPPAGRIYTGEYLRSIGADAYAVPYDRISPAAVAYWHSYDLQVITWTSDSAAIDVPATWDRMHDAGVDVLVTNEPAAALAVLGCTPPTEVP